MLKSQSQRRKIDQTTNVEEPSTGSKKIKLDPVRHSAVSRPDSPEREYLKELAKKGWSGSEGGTDSVSVSMDISSEGETSQLSKRELQQRYDHLDNERRSLNEQQRSLCREGNALIEQWRNLWSEREFLKERKDEITPAREFVRSNERYLRRSRRKHRLEYETQMAMKRAGVGTSKTEDIEGFYEGLDTLENDVEEKKQLIQHADEFHEELQEYNEHGRDYTSRREKLLQRMKDIKKQMDDLKQQMKEIDKQT